MHILHLILERFRVAFTGNGEREVCVYDFLETDEHTNHESSAKIILDFDAYVKLLNKTENSERKM